MDIVQESPWPVYQTLTDLTTRLRADISGPIDLESHRRFVSKYGEWEQGTACKRLYEDVLAPWVTARPVPQQAHSAALRPSHRFQPEQRGVSMAGRAR
jgi:hypothetical protein